MADVEARRKFMDARVDAFSEGIALVSADMPLRANLSVLDNIALIPQYRSNLKYDLAADQAWALLETAGFQDLHAKRDPALSHAERCVAKLLRAVIGRPDIILIDRPALQLPDVDYPPFLFALLRKLEGHLNTCWLVDYQWNRVLYDAHPELTEMTASLP